MQHKIEVRNISPEKATNPKYNVYVDDTCVLNNISWIEVMRSIEDIYLTDQVKHEERINAFLDNIEHALKRAQAYMLSMPQRERPTVIHLDQLEELKSSIEELQEEEEEYRDNMPENLQGSERYEKADEACDNLSDAVSNLEDAVSSIETAIE